MRLNIVLIQIMVAREDPGRQLRVHDTRDTTMRLLVANDPIIEKCDGIVVAPAPEANYPEYNADLVVRPHKPGGETPSSVPRAKACSVSLLPLRTLRRPG